MRKPLGFSLIEILICMLLLSLMLLGLDAMQLTSLQQVKASYYFSVANQQINNMAERLLSYKGKSIDSAIIAWNKQNQTVLPQAQGVITGDYPQYVITLFWGDKTIHECHHSKIGQKGCVKRVVEV